MQTRVILAAKAPKNQRFSGHRPQSLNDTKAVVQHFHLTGNIRSWQDKQVRDAINAYSTYSYARAVLPYPILTIWPSLTGAENRFSTKICARQFRHNTHNNEQLTPDVTHVAGVMLSNSQHFTLGE
jgi:hypothetical protein